MFTLTRLTLRRARQEHLPQIAGTLAFTTETGQGTCFTIRLPAAPTPVDQPRKTV